MDGITSLYQRKKYHLAVLKQHHFKTTKGIKMLLDQYEIPMVVEVAAVVIMGIIFGAMFALSI
jgi:hypothetical protein